MPDTPLISPHCCAGSPKNAVMRAATGATIFTDIPEELVYLRQIARGNVIIGGAGHEPVDMEKLRVYVNPMRTMRKMTQASRLVPPLAKLSVIRVWSGIEGYMRDSQPAMGPSARVPGLFYAFGFSGEGFQLGPGVGEVMAELIDTGATSTPIAQYYIGRFAGSAQEAA